MATQSRGRRRTERAALHAALLDAAARADEEGVRIALARGADVNAADVATDSTVVTCAIAGDRYGACCFHVNSWTVVLKVGTVHPFV